MCSRVFPGSHAALCHNSRCGGVRVDELPNICDLCNRGYGSTSGLSQHRRHMHPEARLQERMTFHGPRRPVGRGRTVWTEEEEEVVLEFGATRGLVGAYAPRIAERLPEKSIKQIRDKVRMLRLAGRLPLRGPEEVAARDEDGDVAPPSSDSEASEESEASAEEEAAPLEIDEWERNPREEWLRSDPRNPLAEELQGEWRRREWPEGAWLEDFVGRVTAACLASGSVQPTSRTKRGAKPKARAGEKRRKYADTQEMFKRCPARLGSEERSEESDPTTC